MNSTFFPVYRISKASKVVVKFAGRNEGYVIDPGTTNFKIDSLHTDWNPYYEDCWEPYAYEATNNTSDHLELFETIRLTGISLSTLTKVPNGYVMTSQSGHQLFIKDLSKDSL